LAKRSGRKRRRGTVVVELLLVLPILLIMLLGMLEFSMILTAEEELLTASREGARLASHGCGDRKEIEEEVRETVKRVLGKGRLGDACVEVHWHPEDPREPLHGRDRVEVVVHLGATHAVPNLLAWAGFSIAKRQLSAATVMNVEGEPIRDWRRDREGSHDQEGSHDHQGAARTAP
jgi:hypothetical protein